MWHQHTIFIYKMAWLKKKKCIWNEIKKANISLVSVSVFYQVLGHCVPTLCINELQGNFRPKIVSWWTTIGHILRLIWVTAHPWLFICLITVLGSCCTFCATAVVPHYQTGTAIPQYRRGFLKVPEYRYRMQIARGTFCGTRKHLKNNNKYIDKNKK